MSIDIDIFNNETIANENDNLGNVFKEVCKECLKICKDYFSDLSDKGDTTTVYIGDTVIDIICNEDCSYDVQFLRGCDNSFKINLTKDNSNNESFFANVEYGCFNIKSQTYLAVYRGIDSSTQEKIYTISKEKYNAEDLIDFDEIRQNNYIATVNMDGPYEEHSIM